MPSYFAIFGKTPALSAAELFAVFEREKIEAKPARVSAAGMIFETSRSDLARPDLGRSDLDFWSQLGGAVKAGEIIWKGKPNAQSELQAFLNRDLRERVPAGRIEFGISNYPLESGTHQGLTSPRGQTLIGAALKKILAADGRSVRRVTSREKNLSAVTINKNKLLGPGVEYCLFSDRAMTFVGITSWVQDYEEFAFREFTRPRADAIAGLVPVKLARMLLNLAAVPRDSTILDPFCGSGTIAAEALALGQKQVIASDLEERAIKETRENIRWTLTDLQRLSKQTLKVPVRILQSPAEEIDRALAGERVDAIVTEPYLGPPLRGRERTDELQRTLNELQKIYEKSFAAFARLLAPGSPVVFIFPIYKKGAAELSINDLTGIENAGFRPDPLLPERFRHTPGFALTARGGIIYSRPDQLVHREILRFRRI